MINCLPFLPLSFHSVFQLSPFISPFSSILYPLITISFLNFLFLSSLSNRPPKPPYSCPTSSFFNDLISLSFMHPTSCLFYFLPLSFISDIPVIISTFCIMSPSSSLQVQSTSWMPHQQYVMQPTVCSSTHFYTAFSLCSTCHIIYLMCSAVLVPEACKCLSDCLLAYKFIRSTHTGGKLRKMLYPC